MSHYGMICEAHNVKFRPGYPETDFKTWWSKQQPCYRDHCSEVSVRVKSTENLTKTRWDRWERQNNKKCDPFLEYGQVISYKCHALLVGIVGWRSVRKVRKVVNHHIQEVEESRDYKTKPTKGLKGATLYAIGRYVITYDARDYDPLEHGEYPTNDD